MLRNVICGLGLGVATYVTKSTSARPWRSEPYRDDGRATRLEKAVLGLEISAEY